MAEATGCCLVAICTPGSTTGHREFIFSSTHLWKEFKFATHQHCRPEGAHLKHRVLGDCNYLKYDDEDGKVKKKRKKYRSPPQRLQRAKGKSSSPLLEETLVSSSYRHPPPRHCTSVGITGRAGCGATSSAALQPKRVGSKRAAQQPSCGSPHRGGTEAARRLQLGLLWGFIFWRKTQHMQQV